MNNYRIRKITQTNVESPDTIIVSVEYEEPLEHSIKIELVRDDELPRFTQDSSIGEIVEAVKNVLNFQEEG